MEYIDYLKYLSVNSIILNDPKNRDVRRLYRLYVLLGRYYNTCILQFNRIEEWASCQKEKGSRSVAAPELYDFSSIYADIHFLLIAMERCYQLEAELYHLLWDNKKKKWFLRQTEVKDVLTMRNTLEHMEEYINKDDNNKIYNLPEEYEKYGYSWMEKQLFSINNGVFLLKDKKLVFSKIMFNHIYEHMWIIINEIQRRINEIN